jgi:cell division protein FtsZ
MKNSGPAWMSVGHGKGSNRAVEAAKAALASPMLDVSISGAKGVLFNVTGGSNLTLFECNEAADVIAQSVDPDANIIFGVVFNPQLEDEVHNMVPAYPQRSNCEDCYEEQPKTAWTFPHS